MTISESEVTDIVVDGVDHADHPDYADAFIQSATYQGRPMTENEIKQLSSDFVHAEVLKSLI